MSQALMSFSVIGWPRPTDSPRPFLSAASAMLEVSASNATAARDSFLGVDMLDLSLGVDAPAGDAVVVLAVEAERVGDGLERFAARGHELLPQRLAVAGVVPGAAHQHRGSAAPAPRDVEARERLRIDRTLQRRLGPTRAAVGR